MRTCVILAAGGGTRLGRWTAAKDVPMTGKAQIPWGDTTLAARAIDIALATGSRPILVLGHRAQTVLNALRRGSPDPLRSAEVVIVPRWHEGMSVSFRAGVHRAVQVGAAISVGECVVAGRSGTSKTDTSQIAVLLVDQPRITAEAMQRVWDSHTPGRITRGAVRGKPSHPVIFDAVDALLAAERATGDRGARDYLREHAVRVDLVDITDCADDDDIDTPDDLNRLSIETFNPAAAPGPDAQERGD